MQKVLQELGYILACQWSIRFLYMVVCSVEVVRRGGLLPLATGCTYVGCIIGSPSHRHSTHYSLCELRYISMGERYWCLFDRTSLRGVKISPSCMPLSSCNLHPDLFWVCPRMTRHSQFLCFWYYFFGSDKDVFEFSRLTVTVIATKLAPCKHQF